MAGVTQDISSVLIDHHSQGLVGTFNGPVHIGNNGNLNEVLKVLPNAVGAKFNAYQRQHDPTCLPNTRVDLLQDIYSWADGQDERYIFWLNGLAGTGKSTIARTVARTYLEQKRLGASFFFSRGGGDVGHAGNFVTSISFQLASSVPSLDQYICDAIKEQRDIASQSLRDQWQQLVVGPLSKLSGGGGPLPYILVVDALDECDNDKDIRIIVQLLAEAQSLKTACLRVFLTSRSEVPIRNGFGEVPDGEHRDFVLHNISPPIVDRDISLFLQHNFRLIGREQSLDIDWPGAEVIEQFVQIAGSLFIWAATACRYIQEGLCADDNVQILLGDSTCTTAPEEHLNELYTTVLRRSIRQNYSPAEKKALYGMLRRILGSIVVLFSPLTASSLRRLLDVAKDKINQALRDLHAILDIPEVDDYPLRLHHPSFRDFLLDPKRCADQDLWVDEEQAHQILADRCIQLMSKSLKQDICGVGAPGMLVTDVERSFIEQGLSPEVQYACCYWTDHVQKSGTQLRDNDQVHVFLQEHLLHWLEALGWIGKISDGVHAIAALESFVPSSECPGLWSFVHDAKRFVLYNRAAIEQAPLQTYGSALVFAPTSSIIRENFEYCIPKWIQKLPRVENEWNTLLQVLEGHTQSVNAVTFSPDGKMLASASEDETVKLWDPASGALLQTLVGHSASVQECTFLPNSKSLLSISTYGEVKVWNSGTGDLLLGLSDSRAVNSAVSCDKEVVPLFSTLQNPAILQHGSLFSTLFSTRYINVISPDGKLRASGSYRNLTLYNSNSGAELCRLKVISGLVKAIGFSQDNKMLALMVNREVMLCDTKSGAELCRLKGISGLVEAIGFSQDNKMLALMLNREVMLCDTKSGAELCRLKGISDLVKAIGFSQDNKMLALLLDTEVMLYDTNSGAELCRLKGISEVVKAIGFSQDNKMLALLLDTEVMLYDTNSGAELCRLKGISEVVKAIGFSQDNKMLALALDTEVMLWDTKSGAELWRIKGLWDLVKAMVFSQDSKMLALALDREVTLRDTNSGAELCRLKGPQGPVKAIGFSRDGKMLALALDGEVALRDTNSGAELCRLKGLQGPVKAMGFSWDGKMLALASSKTVRLWEVSTGKVIQTFDRYAGVKLASATSLDGKLRAEVSASRVVRLRYDVSREAFRSLEGHSDQVTAVDFSPDTKLLASASRDRTVRLWDTSIKPALPSLDAHWDYVTALTFSPDGKFLASAAKGCMAKLWDTDKIALLRNFTVHSGHVNTMIFSPDSRLLALASTDGTISLRKAAEGAVVETLKGHSACIIAMAFSPDGKRLASASGDKAVKLWDTVMGKELKTLQDHSDCVNAVGAVGFSPDGKTLALASSDETVKLWDATSGVLLQTLKGYSGAINSVAFSPDGKMLHTNRGTFFISLSSSSTSDAQTLPPPSISIEGHWVLRHTKRILWLPPDHRPSVTTVHGSTIGFGYKSGRVSIIELDP